jgi:hypothetical protein
MLARIRFGPSSFAMWISVETSAPFAAAYAICGSTAGSHIDCDPISTTEPPPRASKCGIAARTTFTVPTTLTSSARRQSSGEVV